MIRFKATISKNPQLVAHKTLEEVKQKIIDLYSERSKKKLNIVASLRGKKLVFEFTIGKGTHKHKFKEYVSEGSFRNRISEDEFRGTGKQTDRDIVLSIIKDVMKELPSIIKKIDSETK